MLRAEHLIRCQLHDCRAACCLHGVWLDTYEWEQIKSSSDLIAPHMPAEFQDPELWVDGNRDDDPFSASGRVIHTRVLPDRSHYGGTACIFLRADFKCALQVAGESAGLHPWHFKPFYCVLHPLDLDSEGCITLDESEALSAEEASCLRSCQVEIPLLNTFEEELRYILGDQAYLALYSKVG